MTTSMRGIKRLKALLESKEFTGEIERVRQMDEFQRIVQVPLLLNKYKILSKFGPFVSEYVETGILREELIEDSIRIRKNDNGAVSIKLAHDSTQSELVEFIEANWKMNIEPLLPGSIERTRQEVPSLKRDEAIYETYLMKKEIGLTNQGVALRHNVSLSHVTRVISRYKKGHSSSV